MIRETSKLSYEQIKSEGKKLSQEQRILQILKEKRSGLSLSEISALTGFDKSSVSGRVNTLKKNGKVFEGINKVKCPITNRTITPLYSF
jgi:DNA-binding IclR family transcriptional regulator